METPKRPIPTNVLIPSDHRRALKELAARTRISQSEYLREAVSDLLDKYSEALCEPSSPASPGALVEDHRGRSMTPSRPLQRRGA